MSGPTARSASSTPDTYGNRRTDVPSARQPIEIPFGDGLLTLTWEPGPDDAI